MSGAISELIFGYARAFIIGISGQAVGVAICSQLLYCRKNRNKLFIYLLIKTAITMYLNAFLNFYFPGETWAVMTNAIVTTFVALTTWLMFAYTFEGGLLKCNLAMNMSELIAGTVMLPSVMVINIFEGRTDLFSFYGELQWTDFLIIGLEAVLCLLLCFIASPLLRKFRTCRIKYEKVWWVIILFYTIVMQAVAMIDLRNGRLFMITMYMLYLGCAAIGVTGMIMIYRKYSEQLQKRYSFLNMQLGLISTHYASVQEKLMHVEAVQELIDEQMERITGYDKKGFAQGKTEEYLHNIRKEYEKIKNGFYCNDWLIDAVLYCQGEAAKECGIKTEISMAGYDRGTIQEDTLAQILFQLYDFGIRENQKLESGIERAIQIKMQVILKRLVIEFSTNAKKSRKYSLGDIEEFVRMADGETSVEKKASGLRVLIKIPM